MRTDPDLGKSDHQHQVNQNYISAEIMVVLVTCPHS